MKESDFRREAREVLKGKWPKVILIVFLYTLLTGLGATAIYTKTVVDTYTNNTEVRELLASTNANDILDGINIIIEKVEDNQFLGELATYVLQAILCVGYYSILLKVAKKEEFTVGELFTSFNYFLKALALLILIFIYVTLWTMLFIIPGIIKSFSYSMALYIFAQNPEKGINQCITESKEMMKGNKASLFKLQLSFLGWGLLACLAIWIPIAGMIGVYALMVYENVAQTRFYLHVSGQHEIISEETTLI